jgi:hypothetical protein
MRILVQVGNLGNSIIDHHMRPLARQKRWKKLWWYAAIVALKFLG